MLEPDPINRKGQTFLAWLRQAERLPDTRILGSVADPRWTIQLRWAWIECKSAEEFRRKPIRVLGYKIERLLHDFDHGYISEIALGYLLALIVLDRIEDGSLKRPHVCDACRVKPIEKVLSLYKGKTVRILLAA